MTDTIETPALSKLVKLYLDELKIRNLSPNTITKRRIVLQHLVNHSGDELPTDRGMVLEFLSSFYDRGHKPSTIIDYHAICRIFYGWLLDGGVAYTNPFAQVQRARMPETFPGIVRSDELGKIWQATFRMTSFVGVRTRCALLLMLTTGLRRQEMVDLDIDDLDLDANVIRVRRGKGAKERFLPVPREVFGQWLRARARILRGGRVDAVFITTALNRLYRQCLNNDLARLKNYADIKGRCSPHDFRHLFATGCVNEGVHLEALRQMLGHTSLASTSRYTRMATKPLAAELHRARPYGLVRAQLEGREYCPTHRAGGFEPEPVPVNQLSLVF